LESLRANSGNGNCCCLRQCQGIRKGHLFCVPVQTPYAAVEHEQAMWSVTGLPSPASPNCGALSELTVDFEEGLCFSFITHTEPFLSGSDERRPRQLGRFRHLRHELFFFTRIPHASAHFIVYRRMLLFVRGPSRIVFGILPYSALSQEAHQHSRNAARNYVQDHNTV
jgi:hypothetical protein